MKDQVHINRVTMREIIPREFVQRKICAVFVTRSLMDKEKDYKDTIGEYLIAEWRSRD
jgi:hypothetical protein